ncbi:MAG: glyoxalase [Marmoricola sp.]|nr:glyoxalase [Marmoricola sp.]
MVFWQLTINALDPAAQVAFWGPALGYSSTPPTAPDTTWWDLYNFRLGDDETFEDRLFDPDGLRPPIWFQETDDPRTVANRIHLDLYVTGRDRRLSIDDKIALVDSEVVRLVSLGATELSRARSSDEEERAGDSYYTVTLNDPEGNVFCVA